MKRLLFFPFLFEQSKVLSSAFVRGLWEGARGFASSSCARVVGTQTHQYKSTVPSQVSGAELPLTLVPAFP